MSTSFAHSADVTDELVEEATSLIGLKLRYESWNREASWDAIRHYAWGIGDDNPLWCDPDYARNTTYGDIVAPPTYLYNVADAVCSPGLTGLTTISGGADWIFTALRRNEVATYQGSCVDAREIHGKSGGRMIAQTSEVHYFGADGDQIAQARSTTFRLGANPDKQGLSYTARAQYVMTDEDWLRVERDVRAEVRRGAEPRYWEDVEVGDVLTPVVKGPLDQVTMMAYYAGHLNSPGYKAAELRWKNWINAYENPDALPNYVDPSYFAERVLPSVGHIDDSVAHEIGMPGAFDNGPMRVGWLAHLVTNWMGDDGALATLKVRLRLPNLFGDTTWVTGKVIAKRTDDNGRPVADVHIVAVNQLGTEHAQGTAVVVLPTR